MILCKEWDPYVEKTHSERANSNERKKVYSGGTLYSKVFQPQKK